MQSWRLLSGGLWSIENINIDSVSNFSCLIFWGVFQHKNPMAVLIVSRSERTKSDDHCEFSILSVRVVGSVCSAPAHIVGRVSGLMHSEHFCKCKIFFGRGGAWDNSSRWTLNLVDQSLSDVWCAFFPQHQGLLDACKAPEFQMYSPRYHQSTWHRNP